jgi:hypothetical protein
MITASTVLGILEPRTVAPDPFYSLLYLPFILTFFGGVIFVFGRINELQNNKDGIFKWVGVVLLALAFIVALPDLIALQEPIYRGVIQGSSGRKGIIAHFLSPLMPFSVLVGCLGWYFVGRQRSLIR